MKLMYILVAIFLAFWLYRFVRANPQTLTREKLGKSVTTLAWLALILIAFIALLVMLLKA